MQRRQKNGLVVALCLASSVALIGCSGGGQGTGAGPDIASGQDGGAGVPDATLTDAGGGVVDVPGRQPDTPGPVVDTPGPVVDVPAAPWPDGVDPFGPETTGGKPQDPVGRTGWPCQADADCMTDPEHRCLFGVCTERCRDATGALPGACNTISNESVYGQLWGCPTDISFCMPGPVQNKAVICTDPDYCGYLSNELDCRAAIWLGNTTVVGVCLPSLGGKGLGEPCDSYTECESRLCPTTLTTQGFESLCSHHCTINEHCGGDGLCVGMGFDTQDAGTSTAWAGMCSYSEGSLDYCTCQDAETCSMSCDADDEHCREFINTGSNNLTAYYWCVAGIADAADVGEGCVNSEDCATGACYWSANMSLGTSGYCAQPCPGGDADCPEEMRCGKRFLHNAGTPDDNSDDPTYKVCVRGAEGEPCEVNAKDWCA
ncbi:MAG: hypothetical protein QF464_11060, partial [Myxococcota bacterium]|nr:hypothetical protein [Myxococcota bacterium]